MRAVEKLLTSKRLLAHVSRDYAPVAMYQTFCAEDIVLAHLIFSDLVHSEYQNIHMFTIDTGRTTEHVYQAIESMQQRYGKVLTVYHPDAQELELFDSDNGFGQDYYQKSLQVRFRRPMQRALNGHNAWIATRNHLIQPRQSSSYNRDKAWINWDAEHQIPCFNPVARWTQEEIHHYARHHGLSLLGEANVEQASTEQVLTSSSFQELPATAVGVN